MATGAINHSCQMHTAELARQPNYGFTQKFPEEDEQNWTTVINGGVDVTESLKILALPRLV